ncbi:MAG: hypothetical protein IT384_22180 [Deltaproteobacteria bacterium]|nr:hypothetical protein [Deltaproteobacteria bacterium]
MTDFANAADTVNGFCRVINPGNIIKDVAGYALARRPTGLGDWCATCPNALGPEFSSSCVHTESGTSISLNWEIINLDGAPLKDTTKCPSSWDWIEYQVRLENQNDGCTGSGDCASGGLCYAGSSHCYQPMVTRFYGGRWVSGSPTWHWDWFLETSWSTSYQVAEWIGFDQPFDSNYSPTHVNLNHTALLVGRESKDSSWPYVRWHEVRRRCCPDFVGIGCGAWF